MDPMNNNPVDLNVSLTADVTKPVEKTVSTLAKYFDIPPKAISRMGQTTSGLLGLLDEKISQKRLDIRFIGEARRWCALQQIEKKQNNNINSIVSKALAFSSHGNSDISDQEVSNEWLNFFFENAKNISTEDLQLIWANILHGEISNPGSYSLKTFDVLRCLDRDSALSFQNLAQYACRSEAGVFLMIDSDPIHDLRDLYNLTYSTRLSLIESGLLHDSEGAITLIGNREKEHIVAYTYGNYEINIHSKGTDHSSFKSYSPILNFTKAGCELSQFVEHSNDKAIFPAMFRYMRGDGINIYYRGNEEKDWKHFN